MLIFDKAGLWDTWVFFVILYNSEYILSISFFKIREA